MRLTATDLAGERGGEPVFSGVSFSLEQGQCLIVTGENGSGKSTLLRILAGLLPAAGGSVALDFGPNAPPPRTPPRKGEGGVNVAESPSPLRGGVRGGGSDIAGPDEFPDLQSAAHYLGDKNAMKTALTVAENLTFRQQFLGNAMLSVEEALEEVGLPAIASLPFGYLSTGQRRRVALAALLVSYRPLWLLDEPTAGLDLASERRLAGIMRAHLGDGGIIVAATHLPLGLDGAKELVMGEA